MEEVKMDDGRWKMDDGRWMMDDANNEALPFGGAFFVKLV